MNNHTTALVPVATWAYQSPHLRLKGRVVDIGLLTPVVFGDWARDYIERLQTSSRRR